jgi:uncharacterized protein (DUF2249 family)
MTTEFVDVDVRPILRAGGEPFSVIMQAVEGLEPGQGMRLFATFKPIPLFGVLGSRGFSHEAIEVEDGEWEVLFRPGAPSLAPLSVNQGNADASAWPEPSIDLDNRDLDPPEPMARILEATERLKAGEVLSALLLREPRFLFPELARRGHQWRGGFDAKRTTYRILVRVSPSKAVQG